MIRRLLERRNDLGCTVKLVHMIATAAPAAVREKNFTDSRSNEQLSYEALRTHGGNRERSWWARPGPTTQQYRSTHDI